ncbi:MAG: FtsQ-type POTRA domain-containing protein [Patescibacteria group bacterium]
MAKYYGYGYRDELKLKRKKRKIRFAFLVVSSFAVLTGFLAYALFFSSWFSIKEIQVSGNKELSESEIRELADKYINRTYFLGYIKPFSNIFFVSSEGLEESFRKKMAQIDEVDISKSIFKKYLVIEIKEREAVGIWCGSTSLTTSLEQSCFYFDKKMALFKSAPKFSGEVFLVIEDGRNRDFKVGDVFDDAELIEKLSSAKFFLDELKIVDYRNFFLPAGSFEFWIKTKDGWSIYLDKETDIATQLVALKKILEGKLSADRRQRLEYIDLRVNGRVYYK